MPGARPSRAWLRNSVTKEGSEYAFEFVIPGASRWSSHVLRASSQRLRCRCSDCMLPHDQGFPFRRLPSPTLTGAAGSASNTSHVQSLLKVPAQRTPPPPRTEQAQLWTCEGESAAAQHAGGTPRPNRAAFENARASRGGCNMSDIHYLWSSRTDPHPLWVQILRGVSIVLPVLSNKPFGGCLKATTAFRVRFAFAS